ncbi:hypothetical protein ACQP2P_39455 [Dactylosporangium sp. CA-139114]|uniref:hypothetical protein n=1 Tax=Dactylosporangium sp. CA-139114 TaxID=3239931 RepID=UPI003D97082E
MAVDRSRLGRDRGLNHVEFGAAVLVALAMVLLSLRDGVASELVVAAEEVGGQGVEAGCAAAVAAVSGAGS